MSSELQDMAAQNKLAEWAGKIEACRNSGQPVKTWRKENGVCEQTYYKWLKCLVTMEQEQQKVQFAEPTPVLPARTGNVAVTVRLAGAEADICNGAEGKGTVLHLDGDAWRSSCAAGCGVNSFPGQHYFGWPGSTI